MSLELAGEDECERKLGVKRTGMVHEAESLEHLNVVQEEIWLDLTEWEVAFIRLLKKMGMPYSDDLNCLRGGSDLRCGRGLSRVGGSQGKERLVH